MRRHYWFVLTGLLFGMHLVGCSSVPERQLSEAPPRFAMLPNGHDPMNPDRVSTQYAAVRGEAGGNIARVLEAKKGRPLNILSLSGGGQNGAFGAGFLIGWRESGTRPQFDAVGGVSTGALMATHAFLGTPEDDAVLEEIYTQVDSDDIYDARSVFGLAAGADSLMDTEPLKELLEKFITAETLERVAAAADEDRFIVIGTTNIDYDQTWIWNMSAIAKAGELELYHKVLLASSAFPIIFPPVEIDGHLFVDGAARSNVVVVGLAGDTRPEPPLHGPGNIYLIDNGKIEQAPSALRRALGDVAATTIGVMMNQSMQTAIMRSYVGARALGYDFKYIGIEPQVEIGKDPLAFDPNQMRNAFDAGRELGKRGDSWQTDPPRSSDVAPWVSELITGP
jgi:hypothetical protein